MASKVHEFTVEMTCEGCSNAVERVLKRKEGIESFNVDLPEKKVFVTSGLPSDEILECLKKTGKPVTFIGVKN
ncbi:GSCOCG00010617001-RA-CDS [Cotesia congregata]|nr:GSCOCG00010617001-RA-CDS [Cotesia congregata]